jgi:protocatechuate 3,4-dioxygenase beta subunit
MYIKGHKGNESDFIYRELRTPQEREAVTIDFAAMKDSKIGELTASFNIVLGATPSA